MSKEYHIGDVVDNVWDGHNSLEVLDVWYFIYTSPSNRHHSRDILWARLAQPTKPPCNLYEGPSLYLKMVTLRLGDVAYAKEIIKGYHTTPTIAAGLVRYLPINSVPPLMGHHVEAVRYEARRRILEGPFTDVPPIDESTKID